MTEDSFVLTRLYAKPVDHIKTFKQVEEMREQLILDKTKLFTPDAYMVLVMRSMGKV